MTLFSTLIERLRRHPELSYSQFDNGIRIEPPSTTGFAVVIHESDLGWTVCLGEAGFHEEFESDDEALNFIAWCYSGTARLREVWRGDLPQISILETYHDENWIRVSATGFFLVPFWRQRHQIILQNPDLLDG